MPYSSVELVSTMLRAHADAEAVEHFLAFCEQQAHDLLRPHAPIIIALSIVLKIRRTLTSAEIDDVIATTVAGLQTAAERQRRAEWRNAELAAGRFRAECDRLNALRLPSSAQDRVQ